MEWDGQRVNVERWRLCAQDGGGKKGCRNVGETAIYMYT
jgi:hypothetical protein